ncbi:MAG: type IV pilus assembly protein PilM, partial [Candidatus Hydrogenedentes bacterium]|nr:type IV pilus assembly protein PilM [Candidatus Hydrogenedentota bacterium]
MAKVKRGRQKKRLVLDLGFSAIRLCELKKTKTGYQLSRYFQREYSADPAIDEDMRRKIRQQALIELLKEAKVRKQKVIFAVPGQSVFTRSRALPPVPEFKVTQIVRYEIQQQIPFSLDQIAMDYQILSRTEAGGYDVMMAAIKVDVVEKQMDVLAGAKLALDTVDVSPIAAYNWLKHTGEFGEQGECIALIDIGAATTDIVIERDNQFRFTRPLNIGGNDITLGIAGAFGMNYDEAEKAKRQRAFAPTGDPQRDGKAGEVVGKVLQRMVNEIMRSFAYFRSLPGGGTVNRVILCGGGACLRNIVPYMQAQLGVEVRIAQPLAGLAIGPAAQAASESPEQTPVVLGLALRCNEAVPIEINLIPPRVLELARQREQLWYYGLSMATAALILASIIPVSEQKNRLVQQKIDTLRRNIQMYDPLLANQLDQNTGAPSQARQELDAAWAQIRAAQADIQQLDAA